MGVNSTVTVLWFWRHTQHIGNMVYGHQFGPFVEESFELFQVETLFRIQFHKSQHRPSFLGYELPRHYVAVVLSHAQNDLCIEENTKIFVQGISSVTKYQMFQSLDHLANYLNKNPQKFVAQVGSIQGHMQPHKARTSLTEFKQTDHPMFG